MAARSGLSIIEVLVCTVVLAILSFMATVLSLRAHDRAKMTACASQLAQIGKAAHLYAADNDDSFPPYFTITGKPHTSPNPMIPARCVELQEALRTYGCPSQMWRCPSDRFFGDNSSQIDAVFLDCWQVSSYCTPLSLFGVVNLTATGFRFPLSNVNDSSRQPYLADAEFVIDIEKNRYGCAHGNRRNVLFIDTHVANEPFPPTDDAWIKAPSSN